MKTDKRQIKPICPFCEKEVDRLVEVKDGYFTTKRVYCCPHCRKIVGGAPAADGHIRLPDMPGDA